MAAQLVIFRLGWIFKIESIVIPAFLDAIAGSAALRGWLPVLNRLCQSVPPVFFASRLRAIRKKKYVVVATVCIEAFLFLLLAGLWRISGQQPRAWLPIVFFGIYALFFISHGIYQLSWNTLQGELIRPHRRGRLMGISDVVGTALALCFVFTLLVAWLEGPHVRFDLLFTFTGICFLLSAFMGAAIKEPEDEEVDDPSLLETVGGWRTPFADGKFRRVAGVAMCFSTFQMMLPHFQAYGRERLDVPIGDLAKFVAAQIIGTATLSLLAGTAADRHGTRWVLRVLMTTATTVPLLAMSFAWLPREIAGRWYGALFMFVGITPIGFKMLLNHTLEISPLSEHPRYLSTLGLCLLLPLVFSPLYGWAIDEWGYSFGFMVGAFCVGCGAVQTIFLAEPRRDAAPPSVFSDLSS